MRTRWSIWECCSRRTIRHAARGWYEQAAEAGDAVAMFNLGVLLEEDEPAAARAWYEQAVEAGETDAMLNLGLLLKEDEPAVARSWYERAAEAGDAGAMLNLGLLLEDDDPAAERSWYERAAAAGHAGAMFNLGLLLEEDDPAAARAWYERAAEAGDADAMLNLGLLLEEDDPDAAQAWYDRGAEAEQARRRLALSRSARMLREVHDGDLDLFFAFRSDPDAIWMAADPDDPTDRAAFDALWRTMRTDPSVTARTIESDQQVVGYIVSWDHSGQREVEFWIGREYWGQGIATAALSEFLELELERPLYAVAAQDNLGALLVLETFGFQVAQEGTNVTTARGEPVRIFLLAVGLTD